MENLSVRESGTAADTITILEAQAGNQACKRISVQPGGGYEIQSYSCGALFRHSQLEVNNISELSRTLTGLISEPAKLVIRGKLAANRKPRKDGTVFRKKVAGAWQGFFEDQPHHWLLIDIDSLPLPAGLSRSDNPEAVVAHALAALGEPWRSAAVFWHASSKAGLPGISVAKLHLWFWLDTALSSQEATAVLRAINERAGYKLADEALARTVRIHYTANPIFVGMSDPMPCRFGLKNGELTAVPTGLVSFPSKTEKPHKTAQKTKIPAKPVKSTDPKLKSKPDKINSNTMEGDEERRSGFHKERYSNILADILKLAEIRHNDKIADGERDSFFFCACVAAANTDPAGFENSVCRLRYRLIPEKSDFWVEEKLFSLRSAVRRHMNGERVIYGTKRVSPIYSPAKDWFLDQLNVSRPEMDQLSTMIDRTVERKKRRSRVSMAEYRKKQEIDNKNKKKQAIKLHVIDGLSATKSAKIMGISKRRLHRLLEGRYEKLCNLM